MTDTGEILSEMSARRCERQDAVPCDVLLDPHASPLPDHVCRGVLRRSVSLHHYLIPGGAFAYQPEVWPLGVGGERLLDFIASRFLPGRRPVGLIVPRETDVGQVCLLGHVSVEGESSSGARPLLPQWVFTTASVVTTRPATIAPLDASAAVRVAAALVGWFEQVLLGRRYRPAPGRPRGRDMPPEEFIRRLGTALVRRARMRLPLTAIDVATDLDMNKITLVRHLRDDLSMSWSDVKRHVEREK